MDVWISAIVSGVLSGIVGGACGARIVMNRQSVRQTSHGAGSPNVNAGRDSRIGFSDRDGVIGTSGSDGPGRTA